MSDRIFISYRRDDSASASGRIQDALKQRNASVFMDESLEPGEAWPERLKTELDDAKYVIAVIGPKWLTISDNYGRRRLDQEDDWVRLELSTALSAADKEVIPVLVEGGELPPKEALPKSIAALTDRQAIPLNRDSWERDIEALIESLSEPCSDAAEPPRSLSVPLPNVRLPEGYVERPDALNAVKRKLLTEGSQALVVSAISGLGGLGKSVLATALVLDEAVKSHFTDGILWVTLGQKPDLQPMLGDWIRTLDKSREAFSANTLASASSYLNSLLVDKQMLLVVDDVWDKTDAEWFRAGGSGCRMLVTTREVQIEGADTYSLDLMSESEAIALMRQKLKRQWREEHLGEVKAFVRVLGYLPLALNLAAEQIQNGLSWRELRAEFEAERRSVALGRSRKTSALRLLDPLEAWEDLEESEQRKYSLQACFNLSLKRLKPEQLRCFVWLGVLPEDVNLSEAVASVLWDLPLLRAKRMLALLRKRSFLTDGVASFEGERTYRVHDLMHDMARSLVEEGVLEIENLGSKHSNLSLAHGQFLEHYRERAKDRRWNELPNDGYIHRHLTWHMVQANWGDGVHELMAMSDPKGRNAWFEVCDHIGQPAIFVADVGRGWELAEQEFESRAERSIILQCRYALIMATLNSLVANLPIGLMAEFVKRDFWTIEQAWIYVEQIQNEEKLASAIQSLAPYLYLSKPLFQVALAAARAIQDKDLQASVLRALAQIDGAYFDEALAAVRAIQDKDLQASALRALAQIDRAYFDEALAAARAIYDEDSRAEILSMLAQTDRAYFDEALAAVRAIQDEVSRAKVLSMLAQTNGTYFDEALVVARAIQDEVWQTDILSALAQIDGANFDELLAAAKAIQNEYWRAEVLSALAQINEANFDELLAAARGIQHKDSRAEVLSALAQIDGAYFDEALAAARGIQHKDSRAEVLSALAQIDGAYFDEALAAARGIQHKDSRTKVLNALAQINEANFDELLAAARGIQDEVSRAKVLSTLAQTDRDYFDEALAAARAIQDEVSRAEVLSTLAQTDRAHFDEALAAARAIQDEASRAEVLSTLAQIDRAEVLSTLAQTDRAYFDEALAAARAIQDEVSQAKILSTLAQIDGAYFDKVLAAARSIQDEYWRAEVLSALAQIDGANFDDLLAAARSIQHEDSRAEVLRALAQIDGANFDDLLAATRAIQHEYWRAEVLSALAQIDGANFDDLLAAARSIQHEVSRAEVLRALAQINGTYLDEALAAVRAIQDESSRASDLRALAQINGAYFDEALAAVRAIQDEYWRAFALNALAQNVPDDVLSSLWREDIFAFNRKPAKAIFLNQSLPRFLLNCSQDCNLQRSNWQSSLHFLAYGQRSELMQDLAILHPVIVHLGGQAAMRGVVDAMREVCSQWP